MIPFPTMHIADSVLNRVLNALDSEQTTLGLVAAQQMPNVQTTKLLGQEIDAKVATPAAPAELPPESVDAGNAGMLESSVLGGSPFNGALLGGG